jgi:hypothetical protein
MTQLPAIAEQLGPEMQVRLLDHISRALMARQNRWAKQLEADLKHAQPMTPHKLSQVLVNARSRLAAIAAVSRSPLLSADVQDEIRSALAKTAKSAQESLEHSVRNNHAATNTLLGVVRQHSLLQGLSHQAIDAHLAQEARSPAPGIGRRVILPGH